jgi:hypothetical protein
MIVDPSSTAADVRQLGRFRGRAAPSWAPRTCSGSGRRSPSSQPGYILLLVLGAIDPKMAIPEFDDVTGKAHNSLHHKLCRSLWVGEDHCVTSLNGSEFVRQLGNNHNVLIGEERVHTVPANSRNGNHLRDKDAGEEAHCRQAPLPPSTAWVSGHVRLSPAVPPSKRGGYPRAPTPNHAGSGGATRLPRITFQSRYHRPQAPFALGLQPV